MILYSAIDVAVLIVKWKEKPHEKEIVYLLGFLFFMILMILQTYLLMLLVCCCVLYLQAMYSH
jgi:hypothetical protein